MEHVFLPRDVTILLACTICAAWDRRAGKRPVPPHRRRQAMALRAARGAGAFGPGRPQGALALAWSRTMPGSRNWRSRCLDAWMKKTERRHSQLFIRLVHRHSVLRVERWRDPTARGGVEWRAGDGVRALVERLDQVLNTGGSSRRRKKRARVGSEF